MQMIVAITLLGIAASAMLCFLLLIVLYSRKERRWRARLEQTKADIADLAILFQTMRDVITQQKSLAREFNQELEKKVSQVKQVLAKSIEKNERLYEQQQVLAGQLQESHAQLESLQRQINFLHDALSAPRPAAAPSAPEPVQRKTETPLPGRTPIELVTPHPAAPSGAVPPVTPFEPVEAPEVNQTPVNAPAPKMAFADWSGFEEEAVLEAVPAPVQEDKPIPPGEAESARAAFRALLDMPSAAPLAPESTAMPAQPAAGDNGGRPASALQQRILEYSGAGMSIPEIARELGIGKGEVRLMLSLAKQKRT